MLALRSLLLATAASWSLSIVHGDPEPRYRPLVRGRALLDQLRGFRGPSTIKNKRLLGMRYRYRTYQQILDHM